MDCQVKFEDKDSVREMALRFENMPRVGERISFDDGQDHFTGLVSGISHKFSKDGPQKVIIHVEID